MTSTGSVTGSVEPKAAISGSIVHAAPIFGTVSLGGSGGPKNAVLYVEQELTDEQIMQARENIRIVGKSVEGITFTPYTVDVPNGYVHVYGDEVVAEHGAEVYNYYDENIATGMYSIASGFRTQATGMYSDASGWWTVASGIAAKSSGLLSIASGNYSLSEGNRSFATANNAHAEGEQTTASGARSHAEGYQTVASHNQTHSEGMNTTASGLNSHSEGEYTTASGRASWAGGARNVASGREAFACGRYNEAKGRNQFVCGQYNTPDTTSLMIVGKGGGESTRSNAFTVSTAGAGWFAGAVTSTGADYAEYFEWLDGNPNLEDRIGLAVALDGEKIRPANTGDDVLGIISGTAMVIGDNFEHEWKGKYLTDEYGRIIYDDPVEEFEEYTDCETGESIKESTGFYVYPKLNPNYDPSQPYTSRANRNEWGIVGMLGKLHAKDDGTCVVNKYAKVGTNGILTASSERTNLRIMRRISENVVLVLMK